MNGLYHTTDYHSCNIVQHQFMTKTAQPPWPSQSRVSLTEWMGVDPASIPGQATQKWEISLMHLKLIKANARPTTSMTMENIWRDTYHRAEVQCCRVAELINRHGYEQKQVLSSLLEQPPLLRFPVSGVQTTKLAKVLPGVHSSLAVATILYTLLWCSKISIM